MWTRMTSLRPKRILSPKFSGFSECISQRLYWYPLALVEKIEPAWSVSSSTLLLSPLLSLSRSCGVEWSGAEPLLSSPLLAAASIFHPSFLPSFLHSPFPVL